MPGSVPPSSPRGRRDSRRHSTDEGDSHDRWLVSYADLVTLLFAFFVVMYAISSVNEGKYRVISEALNTAFGKPTGDIAARGADAPAQPQPLLRPRARAPEAVRRERERMTALARDVADALAPLVREGKVRVTQSARGISVEINAAVLFASGEARLTEGSQRGLVAIARVLREVPNALQVEGHTDNAPIASTAYASNWELSAVRATSVVRLFAAQGIEEARLTAVGRGENRPIGDNATAEGRARNRRVTLLIHSALPDVATELPTFKAERVGADG